MAYLKSAKESHKRFLWLMIPLAIQLCYFPLNRFSLGGFVPNTPLDQFIPLWPVWTAPYVLTLPMWLLAYAWAGLKMEDELFWPFLWASIGAMSIGILTFLLLPTYVVRPDAVGSGLTWDWLRHLYMNDGSYNALPSGHAYITGIIMLFWMRWKPKYKRLWGAIYGIVLLSTLFTHQHYLLDLAAGMLLALIAYRFSISAAARSSGDLSPKLSFRRTS